MTRSAPYEKSKFLGSGGSMVARLKLKDIDGRAPPGVKLILSQLLCALNGGPFTRKGLVKKCPSPEDPPGVVAGGIRHSVRSSGRLGYIPNLREVSEGNRVLPESKEAGSVTIFYCRFGRNYPQPRDLRHAVGCYGWWFRD